MSGQDDVFQTGNQPISLRHLSQPCNKTIHLLNLSPKDDCIFLTQEYRLKEFSAVILQQQFIYYFNTTIQTVHVYAVQACIQGHAKYVINSLLFMLLYIIIPDRSRALVDERGVEIGREIHLTKTHSIILDFISTFLRAFRENNCLLLLVFFPDEDGLASLSMRMRASDLAHGYHL